MRCPNCGREASGKFCNNCGARLPDAADGGASPAGGSESEPQLDAGSTRVITPEDMAALSAREAELRTDGTSDTSEQVSGAGEAGGGTPAPASADGTPATRASVEQPATRPPSVPQSPPRASRAETKRDVSPQPGQRGFLGWLKSLWSGKGGS